MSYLDAAAESYLRTAIRRLTKIGKRPCQGACGTYDACTNTSGRMPKTTHICPLCAVLLTEKESTSVLTNEHLLEELAAEALDVSPNWVISMLRGWDGDEYGIQNEVAEAYKVGKRLWRDMGGET